MDGGYSGSSEITKKRGKSLMIGLVPSILSADFTRLGEQVREADAAGAQRIQIDIAASENNANPLPGERETAV